MKVYISGYRYHWISPYLIMEKFFFWRDGYDANDHEPPEWLTAFCLGLKRIADCCHPYVDYVKIDKYDTWSMDHTLSGIILPMLKQLKETKHGSPGTNDNDVPEILRSYNAPALKNEWDVDANHHLRWEWILGEMLFAFQSLVDNTWEDEFRSGESDLQFVKTDDGLSQMIDGPNSTLQYDREGSEAYYTRMQNGFRLFGVYYRGLWD